ncbi:MULTISPECIES: YhcB family protein [unclassified Agarivorans]|uniref:YhcB family protein n=1 Tax=unclassified Agarivorans TaxID=2636026 RepID=UPI0010ED01AA|nr:MULTISPECIES: YhcB family protein [unclassified Agarivorans]MDO6686887.1 YhcB family protein [Agarivorans sp. 3_MG-2023]MDO6716684.1 YhcB family protein [Agarivorans sp. 2_MG-2023]MDO6764577.1 YhcB family protein [Agarivorans sp. 1_MG-2023]GDY26515.1 cytochrome D ubiquinol oxidase subunit III [Agarivorans sp. Toyoura001]
MSAISSMIFLLIGVAIGFFLSRMASKPAGTNDASMKQELAQNKAELDSYKEQVQEHFSTSAQLLEDMAKQYQGIYEHMASQSKSLISDDVAQPQLFADYQEKLEVDDSVESNDAQPKDYSNEPSGLFTEAQRKAS